MKGTFRMTLGTLAASLVAVPVSAGLTLERCQELARANYPLLRQYCIVRQAAAFTVENIERGWLPQVGVSGQASLQSDVATLPDALTQMLAAGGYDVKGLEKDQYRVGVDVSQLVWDGGALSARRDEAEREADVQTAQTDVDMYAVRERVDQLFFGVLLLDDRLLLNDELQRLLQDNCRKLEAMVEGGTAMAADAEAVRAEWLTARQQRTELLAMRKSYRQMLAIFIGRDTAQVADLERPAPVLPQTSEPDARPEMRLFAAQEARTDARRRSLDAALKPTFSAFAQGYYGYPGYDMFGDMFSHDWTLNGVIGVRLTWNLSRFYTHKNERRQLELEKSAIATARDVFRFNTSLQTAQETADIARYRRLMDEDDDIIRLRTSVRQAAEARLQHGVIDVNTLLQEISRENTARLNRSSHEIELLRAISELKHTINQ